MQEYNIETKIVDQTLMGPDGPVNKQLNVWHFFNEDESQYAGVVFIQEDGYKQLIQPIVYPKE